MPIGVLKQSCAEISTSETFPSLGDTGSDSLETE